MVTELDLAAVSELGKRLRPNTPIYVLNLLRFREEAQYPAGIETVGRTGRVAYFQGYVPAFGAIAREKGLADVQPVWIGDVVARFATAPGDDWDMVAIVEYPSVEAFLRIVDSEAYRRIAEPFRRAALAEWRLIAQTKLELPV